MMIPSIPNPYLILGAVLTVIAAFFIGDHHGYSAEHAKFVTFQDQVRAQGEIADAKNKAIVASREAVTQRVIAESDAKLTALQQAADAALKIQQDQHAAEKQQATEDVKNDYESKINAIHAMYAGRLRSASGASSGNVPKLSLSTPPAYDESAYNVLAANCSITTQMLLSLQDWVRGQEAVK